MIRIQGTSNPLATKPVHDELTWFCNTNTIILPIASMRPNKTIRNTVCCMLFN